MDNNDLHNPENFTMVKLPDGSIINVKGDKTLFPHTQGLSNLTDTALKDSNNSFK